MAALKLKKLEEYLQSVDGFIKPKIGLEQYVTPAHIASMVIYTAQSQFGDIEGKSVADLGCGTGMLSIGACLLGAKSVTGFEIDEDAVKIFKDNVSEMELDDINCVEVDILNLCPKWHKSFDTVTMNPPFGTKNNSGIDMQFLQTGIRLATSAVYSLHKSSTRDHISKKSSEWGVKGTVVAYLKYNIEASYKFHKTKSVDVDVDLWRFDVSQSK